MLVPVEIVDSVVDGLVGETESRLVLQSLELLLVVVGLVGGWNGVAVRHLPQKQLTFSFCGTCKLKKINYFFLI